VRGRCEEAELAHRCAEGSGKRRPTKPVLFNRAASSRRPEFDMIKEIPLHGRAPKQSNPGFTKQFGTQTSLKHDGHASGGCFGISFWGGVSWRASSPRLWVHRKKREFAHDGRWETVSRGPGESSAAAVYNSGANCSRARFGVLYVRHFGCADVQVMTGELS